MYCKFKKYINDVKMESKLCIRCPGELRGVNDILKDITGMVLIKIGNMLGVDTITESVLFS